MVDLTPDDERILDHTYRYRITTPQVLARSVLCHCSVDDIRYRYRRLRSNGILVAGELYYQQPYYALTPDAAMEFYSTKEGGHVPERGLVDHYAMLLYCTRKGSTERKLSPHDIRNALPELKKKNVTPHRYYTNTASGQLGYIRVDQGLDFRRAPEYVKKTIRKHSEWNVAIESGVFVYTVITVTRRKANLLTRALSPVSGVPIKVFVIEELIHMIEP